MDIPDRTNKVDKLFTISEVAEKLRLTPKTLRRWEDGGKFSASRTIGRQRRYTVEDLQILDAIKHGSLTSKHDLLTIDQAASLFGVTTQTIGLWEQQGKLHPFITSRSTYYSKSKLLEKLDSLQQSIPSQPELEPEPSPTIIDNPITKPKSTPSTTLENLKKLTPLQSSVSPKQVKMTKTPPLSPSTHAASRLPTLPRATLSSPILLTIITNIFITLGLLLSYHQLFNSRPISPSPTGSVQGITTTADPLDTLLRSVFDSTGNLDTPGSISTKQSLTIGQKLLLTPSTTPQEIPGTIYYDTNSQTLKIFTQGAWHQFPGTTPLPQPDSTTLASGQGVLSKGKSSLTITDPSITSDSHITLTFLTDYSPAKKYWLSQGAGSFILHTDFPPGTDSSFAYLILTPGVEESTSPTPGN